MEKIKGTDEAWESRKLGADAKFAKAVDGFARTIEEVASECEKLFQNGGPKIYFWNATTGSLVPSFASSARFAAILARLDDNGTKVFARRKVHGKQSYVWREVRA